MKKVTNQLYLVLKKSELMRLFLTQNILEITGGHEKIPKYKHFGMIVDSALQILEKGFPIAVSCSPEEKLYKTTFYMNCDKSPSIYSNFITEELEIFRAEEDYLFINGDTKINVNKLDKVIFNSETIVLYSLINFEKEKLVDIFEEALLTLVEGYNVR